MNIITRKSIIIAATAFSALAGTGMCSRHTITFVGADPAQTFQQIERTAFRNCELPQGESAGHTFTGWYTEKGKKFSGSGILLSDEKLHARFEPNTYQLTLKDGEQTIESSYTYGKQTVIEAPEAFLDAHPYEDFVTWTDGTEQRALITAWTIGDKELSAVWTGKTYTIRYELDGGMTDNPASYRYGEGIPQLASASKEGYVFDGWYTDAEKKDRIESISSDSHEDLTLYAGYHKEETADLSAGSYGSAAIQGGSYDAGGQASNGYNWSAVHAGQAEIDAGQFVDYSGDGYYAAHSDTAYGSAIASWQPGQQVTVNGRVIQIDGEVYGNYNTDDMVDIYLRAGDHEAMFQTCIDDAGNIVVKYGHYVS